RHFFAAAAAAMRRVPVESARRKGAAKRGGGMARRDAGEVPVAAPDTADDLAAVGGAPDRPAGGDAAKAELVRLRFSAGLTAAQAAGVLGVSAATADRYWAYARAWLYREIAPPGEDAP